MNKKIFKILFILSFLPYIGLLLVSFYHAIFGYDVYTWILPVYKGTIYGLEAFKETFIINFLALTFIPVIPICFIYQIVYIFIKIIKNREVKF